MAGRRTRRSRFAVRASSSSSEREEDEDDEHAFDLEANDTPDGEEFLGRSRSRNAHRQRQQQEQEQQPYPSAVLASQYDEDCEDKSRLDYSDADDNELIEDDADNDVDGAKDDGNDYDPDTFRILVSTDNHLGYLEKDPIRGMDSFAAFEEVCQLAKAQYCDFVLLAGDLFHDNKPSRQTLFRTMEIMRRYCMGPNPVRFRVMSDSNECFRSSVNGVVNYDDEYFSVDLPVFSIHGNHDDPTRDGCSEMLAALDLLAVSNLLNYFGRSDEVDKVVVKPVLMEKGSTKIALYGLGSLRDERLNRMWQNNKVKFLRADTEEEEADWFSIFALHQNRDYGRGMKNCVKEDMIPEWMDLVVWGHEHECLINLSESLIGTYRISQPGSSVATSLSAGETQSKCVGILEVRQKQFRLTPIPLKQVRSFVMNDISLSNPPDGGNVIDPEDPDVEEKITCMLINKVKDMISEARDKQKAQVENADRARGDNSWLKELERQSKYKLSKPDHVLVRLKVEHMGLPTLNKQRFGARFVKEVGNPDDILLFHRKRKEPANSTSDTKSSRARLQVPIAPEELEDTNVYDLLNDKIDCGDRKLEIYNQRSMGVALSEFVDKQTNNAFEDLATKMLKEQQKKLIMRGRNVASEGGKITNAASVREVCKLESQIDTKKESHDDKSQNGNDEDANEAKWTQSQSSRSVRKKAKKIITKQRVNFSESSHSEDEYIGSMREKPIEAKAVRKPARRPKKQSNAPSFSDDEEISDFEVEVKNPSRLRNTERNIGLRSQKKRAYAYDSDSSKDNDRVSVVPRGKGITRKFAAKSNVMNASLASSSKKTRQTKLNLSEMSQGSVKRRRVAPSNRSNKKLSAYDPDQDSSEDEVSFSVNTQASRRSRRNKNV